MPYGSGKGFSSVGGTFDGGGAVPTAASVFYFVAQFSGAIDRWDMIGDSQVGSAVIDVWKVAGAIPTVANTIVSSQPPTITGARFAINGAMNLWPAAGRAVLAGDIFGFSLTSVATFLRVTVELRIAQA